MISRPHLACSQLHMLDYWKFVQYVAVLDESRWLKRALTWNAGGGRRGRSFDLWDAPVTKFCRWQNIGEWQVAARDKALWLQYLPDFVTFVYAFVIYLLGLTPCALNGLPHHGIQVQSQKSKFCSLIARKVPVLLTIF